jgi:chaperone modulatory protein CbpM
MVDRPEFLKRAQLDAAALESWIEAGWLLPDQDGGGWRFSEVDLARTQLIHDLRNDLGINDEGVTVVLDLLDQIHGLRRTLRTFVAAVHAQPEALRRRILADISGRAEPDRAPDDNDADRAGANRDIRRKAY